jgi:triacylglycerol esterase/lipase EstA (alpha/beta hydrolase family)
MAAHQEAFQMMRRVLLMVAVAVLFSTALHAKTGVVFIHGKGGASLAQASVARAYWGEDMIRATTKGFTIPYLICAYDGTQYMWVAGGTVAGQIYNWMTANAIDDIVIETHSFGGVVIRWILSNPTYDSRYQPSFPIRRTTRATSPSSIASAG